MNQLELKAQFTEEFFEEFQHDSMFRNLFEGMARGLTPYEAIEHLCRNNKEIISSLERAIKNTPQRIVVTTDINALKNEELKNNY